MPTTTRCFVGSKAAALGGNRRVGSGNSSCNKSVSSCTVSTADLTCDEATADFSGGRNSNNAFAPSTGVFGGAKSYQGNNDNNRRSRRSSCLAVLPSSATGAGWKSMSDLNFSLKHDDVADGHLGQSFNEAAGASHTDDDWWNCEDDSSPNNNKNTNSKPALTIETVKAQGRSVARAPPALRGVGRAQSASVVPIRGVARAPSLQMVDRNSIFQSSIVAAHDGGGNGEMVSSHRPRVARRKSFDDSMQPFASQAQIDAAPKGGKKKTRCIKLKASDLAGGFDNISCGEDTAQVQAALRQWQSDHGDSDLFVKGRRTIVRRISKEGQELSELFAASNSAQGTPGDAKSLAGNSVRSGRRSSTNGAGGQHMQAAAERRRARSRSRGRSNSIVGSSQEPVSPDKATRARSIVRSNSVRRSPAPSAGPAPDKVRSKSRSRTDARRRGRSKSMRVASTQEQQVQAPETAKPSPRSRSRHNKSKKSDGSSSSDFRRRSMSCGRAIASNNGERNASGEVAVPYKQRNGKSRSHNGGESSSSTNEETNHTSNRSKMTRSKSIGPSSLSKQGAEPFGSPIFRSKLAASVAPEVINSSCSSSSMSCHRDEHEAYANAGAGTDEERVVQERLKSMGISREQYEQMKKMGLHIEAS